MALPLFDVHAHYGDHRFDEDREELLKRIHRENHVVGIVDAGDNAASSVDCVKRAEQYDFIYAAAGIHPLHMQEISDADLQVVESLLTHPKVVAVGEIGLDYHYDDSAPKEVQHHFLMKQIELAQKYQKPIVFHDRDAHADSMEVLKKAASMGVGGIVHCFSGSVEMLREVMKLGFHISLGGTVTFKNANKVLEVAKEVPLDRLLLETDCPYLAPTPFRGQRNDSSMICYAAERIAELRGMTAEEICEITYANSLKLFGLAK